MTEQEWLNCDHPAAMLIYLRGEVSAEEMSACTASLHGGAGVLYPGPSPIISGARFTAFVATCAARLRAVPVDRNTELYLETFQRHVDGEVPLDVLHACRAAMNSTRKGAQRSAADYLLLEPAIDPY